MTDNYSNRETGFVVDLGATKWFSEKHPLTLKIIVDQTGFKDNEKSELNNIHYQPSFTYHHDLFYVKAGMNIASNRDLYSFFPDAELGLRIFGDGLQVFAGATGDLRKNTYRSMATYSPFMDIREAELRNTHFTRYYGGLKGELGWLTYHGEVAYENARDLALFQTFYNPLDITRFQVLYDTVDLFNIKANAEMEIFKNMLLSGTFSTTVFTPKNEAFAWGLPVLESHIQATYAMFDEKLRLKAGVFLADDIPFLDEFGGLDRGDFLYDLSIGATYALAKNISLFGDFNNLLNNRRERWLNYPTLGTNLFAGVQMKF
jgi:outer membrane receptor protein involved in Fe transport